MADEQDSGDSQALSADEQAITSGQEPAAPQPQAEQPALEQDSEQQQPEGGERAPAFVPIGELQKERNRRKDIERKARESEEKFQRLAGRLDVLQQAWQPQQPKAEEPKALPPVMEAPLDHIEHQGRELAEFKAWRQQQEERGRVEAARSQFLGHIAARENEYRAAAPDYDAAIQHLRADRAAELGEAGYNAEQASQIIDGEAMAIAESALRQGRNPAEVWYKMAARRGYKPAQQQQNGAERIDTIERGQQAGRSLSQAAGAAPPGKITVDSLLKMDDDDFAKLSEKAWKQAMGG